MARPRQYYEERSLLPIRVDAALKERIRVAASFAGVTVNEYVAATLARAVSRAELKYATKR